MPHDSHGAFAVVFPTLLEVGGQQQQQATRCLRRARRFRRGPSEYETSSRIKSRRRASFSIYLERIASSLAASATVRDTWSTGQSSRDTLKTVHRRPTTAEFGPGFSALVIPRPPPHASEQAAHSPDGQTNFSLRNSDLRNRRIFGQPSTRVASPCIKMMPSVFTHRAKSSSSDRATPRQ